MENNEKIFDLFRENEHKLDAPPSSLAWDRLEHKLDNKNTARRAVMWNYYAAAAGIILLLVAGIFYLQHDNSSQHLTDVYAQAESIKDNTVYEETKPARPILMSHKEKQFYLGNLPIAANDKKSKLNTSPLSKAEKENIEKTEIPIENNAIALNEPRPAPPKTSSTITPTPSKPSNRKSDVSPITTFGGALLDTKNDNDGVFGDDISVLDRTVVEKQTRADKAPAPVVLPPPSDKLLDEEMVEEIIEREESKFEGTREQSNQVITSFSTQSIPKEKKRKKKAEAVPSAPAATEMMDQEDELRDIALGSAVTAEAQAKSSQPESVSQNYQISQLDWMSGSWINNEANTKEVWETVSASQLIGKIYEFGDANESYETDLIQIKKSRGKIILIQQNEVFDLVEISGKKAVFKSQENRKTWIKISQSGNKLKIIKQQPNNSKTKVLKKEE